MNKQKIDTYTETELLSGKTKQEIFNTIVSTSNYNIHDVAEVIRKVPSFEKRKKHSATNSVLVGLLGLTIVSRILIGLGIITDQLFKADPMTFISIVVPLLLMYGIYKFKRNAHLIAALFMLFSSIWASLKLLQHFDLFLFADILITLFGSALAFYLSAKLTGDYELNKALQQTDPEQRENSVTFTE